MTFELADWLKSQYADLNFAVPIWYPAKLNPDHREWLITNGLGGYASSTVSGAHTRRYHGMLVAALKAPQERHLILSRVDELITIDGREYELATNHWASGVVSPTGYKHIESFALLPAPTWVYELDGHYLIKQICLKWGSNEVYVGYNWLPNSSNPTAEALLSVRFLTGFRSFHGQVSGAGGDHNQYPQFVSPNHSVIIFNESANRLCLGWSDGAYDPQNRWWWNYQWPQESARNLPDREDLLLVGSINVQLKAAEQFSIGAGLDKAIEKPDYRSNVTANLKRQVSLLKQAGFSHSTKSDLLVLACDQFLVSPDTAKPESDLQIIEGYPWFNESGRAAMISLPGLTLATHRFFEAKQLLHTYAKRIKKGLLPSRSIEEAYFPSTHSHLEYSGADTTLWWGWAVHHYYKATNDIDFVKNQLPLMLDAAQHYMRGTNHGIKVDLEDGLLRCADPHHEFSWMDAKVADTPITHRAGKAMEICALWYNFLETILALAHSFDYDDERISELQALSRLCRVHMQKFWHAEKHCLYDVIEPSFGNRTGPDRSVRPNQIIAVALPFRAFEKEQEKSIIQIVEAELFTPMGLRTLATSDPAYQSTYGCGFAHADQYHRDLSYHQGTAWPWLFGPYPDALVNVYGLTAETATKIALIIQPLIGHMMEEGCLGSIGEIFDGSRPHLPHGAIAYAPSVAAAMRWYNVKVPPPQAGYPQ